MLKKKKKSAGLLNTISDVINKALPAACSSDFTFQSSVLPAAYATTSTFSWSCLFVNARKGCCIGKLRRHSRSKAEVIQT